MPLTAAAGPIATAEQRAATTLATCDAFQTLTAADDATEAAASIYFDCLPPPEDSDEHTLAELQDLRPFAIISVDPENGHRWQHDASGATRHFKSGGRLLLQLEKDIHVDDVGDDQEALRKWKNEIGNIVDDLLDLAATGTHLAVREVNLLALFRSSEEERQAIGDCVGCVLEIAWGRI